MLWRFRLRAWRAANRVLRLLMAGACVVTLAGCGPDGAPGPMAGLPRGATVAFVSIDGPPPVQFAKLVHDLNTEAQTRQLAVTSRDSPAAYRVRGYLAAQVAKGATTISWVWDVFDQDQRRVLRISGAETEKDRRGDAWSLADDAMLERIAHTSMDQLAAFLAAPSTAPGEPPPAQVALLGR